MRYLVVCVLLFFSLVAHSQQLSVMSYNIRCGHCDNSNSNNWESRKEMVLAVIKKHDPDILGLQETMPSQLAYLKTNLPDYNYYGTGRDAKGTDEGCYIFYKRNVLTIDSIHSGTKWYASTPDIPGSNDMGDSYNRIVTYARFKSTQTNRPFYHFNTHLTYVDSLQVCYVNFLSDVIKTRPTQDPFIITGDFNADERSPAIHVLKERLGRENLIDPYRTIDPTGVVSTFNYFTGEKDGKKIDYIFIEADQFTTIHASCDTTEINGKYPSDHHALNAVIRMRE